MLLLLQHVAIMSTCS